MLVFAARYKEFDEGQLANKYLPQGNASACYHVS